MGDEHYCNKVLCSEGQGDCDSDVQCKGDLVCGNNNCEGPEFSPGSDCCCKNVFTVQFCETEHLKTVNRYCDTFCYVESCQFS